MFVARNALSISSKILCRQQILLPSVNFLYSRAALGVDGYEHSREKVKQQFSQLEDKFKMKMSEFVETPNATIFTEDLKHMIHLANEGTDLTLVKQMVTKFATQNKSMRFGSYIFGPVVMRMYYYLNKPLDALEAFNDPNLDGFFDQLGSSQILMDLLFNNELYDDVIDVFETIKKKQFQGAKYPKNAVVLVFAALYKLNTPESNELSKKLWADLNNMGHFPMRRAATFAAALAINNKEPGVALEMLTSVKKQSYVTVRNLKICALADLGRPDDALPILRNVIMYGDSTDSKAHTFSKEALTKMEAAVQKLNIPEVTDEFSSVQKKLTTLNLIVNTPLDNQLCTEIELVRQTQTEEYRPRNRNNNNQFRRPGLMDMV